jgi:hypothetical protein
MLLSEKRVPLYYRYSWICVHEPLFPHILPTKIAIKTIFPIYVGGVHHPFNHMFSDLMGNGFLHPAGEGCEDTFSEENLRAVVAHAKTCSGRIWLWHTMMIHEQYIYIFICVCMYIDYVILINEYHDLDRLNYIIIKYWLILLMNAIVFFNMLLPASTCYIESCNHSPQAHIDSAILCHEFGAGWLLSPRDDYRGLC